MTEFVHLCAQAIWRRTASQPNSCNLFIFQTLLVSVHGSMVRDVSQEIVPNIVTHFVVVIHGKLLLLLKRESAHCSLMPWIIPDDHYLVRVTATVSRKCYESVAKCYESTSIVFRKIEASCESVSKVLARFLRNIAACCDNFARVAKVLRNGLLLLRVLFFQGSELLIVFV